MRYTLIVSLFFSFFCSAEVDLTVYSYIRCGFFWELQKVLDNIVHFEDEGLARVNVEWTQPFFPYKDSLEENGWPLFFEPIQLKQDYEFHNPIKKVNSYSTWYHEFHDNACPRPFLFPERYKAYRLWGHKVLKKYIKVKEHIQNEVDVFFNNHLKGYAIIGVHVRYCAAHGREVPGGRVPELQEYFEQVDKIISNLDRSKIKIYVASDSHYAVDRFKERYKDLVVYLEEAFRDAYRSDPHLIDEDYYYWKSHPEEFHAKKPGYKGGKEALIDCLLLSKCTYLIHTVSNLATFAIFFNPSLKTFVLPKSIKNTPCWLLQAERKHDCKKIKNQWHLNL